MKPLICIVGETASGKSELGYKLAQSLGAEIICADSQTIRKGFDLGTAKPNQIMQNTVRHHLIDIIEPNDNFNAAKFAAKVKEVIEDIYSRGKVPILVGGTGLYVDAVIYNYSFLPRSNQILREELNNLSLDQLYNLILNKGYKTKNIDVHNKRRLIRIIETKGAQPRKSKLRPNTFIIGVTLDRNDLKARIQNRIDQMIRDGLEIEVRGLVKKFGWDIEGLKTIGYIQFKEYLEGNITIDQVKLNILQATLNLAKRQRTWFRRNKSIHWYKQPINLEDIVVLTTSFLNESHFN